MTNLDLFMQGDYEEWKKLARPSHPQTSHLAAEAIVEGKCWLWGGVTAKNGYGYMTHAKGHKGTRLAHRVVYEALVGPIPEGLTLDHLCRVRSCVNPKHLEPVTFKENVLRGNGFSGRNARKTHCVNGHEFTPENTYSTKAEIRGRVCKTCVQERLRANYQPNARQESYPQMARPNAKRNTRGQYLPKEKP